MTYTSERQKAHYNRILDLYEQHYFDSTSNQYRKRFIYDFLFNDIDFNNKKVADLASGSGFNTLALLERFPNTNVVGIDISDKACEAYQKVTNRPAYVMDLTKEVNLDFQVDVAMIFGGLHHCVSDLPNTFKTISKILKPGGIFLMYEPNANYFLETIRKICYKASTYFDSETEHALTYKDIVEMATPWFSSSTHCYKGGPAYFLILNSMIFHVPLKLKKWIAPPLFLMEKTYNLLPGKYWYPTFLAKWERKKLDTLTF